jgi:hypothetical protein
MRCLQPCDLPKLRSLWCSGLATQDPRAAPKIFHAHYGQALPKLDRRRALELVAGCGAEGTLRANGFAISAMVELIRAGLATATAERVVAGSCKIEVARVRITDAGRKVLAASAFNLSSVKRFTLRLPTICQSDARSISEEMTDAQAHYCGCGGRPSGDRDCLVGGPRSPFQN